MEKDKKLETILILVLALIVCYWITSKMYLLGIAFVIGITGLLVPYAADKIHWIWMKFSHVLGYVTNKVLLAIVFFFILCPFSLMAKLTGRRIIQLKAGGSSYFKSREFTYTKESLENVW